MNLYKLKTPSKSSTVDFEGVSFCIKNQITESFFFCPETRYLIIPCNCTIKTFGLS